jgi:hypothetical protein
MANYIDAIEGKHTSEENKPIPGKMVEVPEEKKQQILLRAFTDENCDIGVDMVVLNVTRSMIERWIEKIDQVKEMKVKEPELLRHTFWDSTPDWYSSCELEAFLGDEKYTGLETQVHEGEVIILAEPAIPDDFDPWQDKSINDSDRLRVECVVMNVTDSDLYWTALEKNTDNRIETTTVLRSSMVNMLKTFW